jgi:tetratricopeptide (TPR) repeat protein
MKLKQLWAAIAYVGATALFLASTQALAQNINLLPKFGSVTKTEEQKKLDAEFLKGIDDEYKGNRIKASDEITAGGFEFLQRGNLDAAMVRFNQAWLANNRNGTSLWGMGIVLASANQFEKALPLFAEAEPLMYDDLIFATDYAKMMGVAGAELKKPALMTEALVRFPKIYAKDPQNTMNLQNWAITLFYSEKFADAWEKIKLAEATPRKAELDSNFIEALQSKMPRPK